MRNAVILLSLFLIGFLYTPVSAQTNACMMGDTNGDGKVNLTDFEVWRRVFMGGTSPTATPAPQPSVSPAFSGSVKIMPLGDSITEGESAQYIATYRYPLQDMMHAANCTYDMVGSQNTLPFRANPPGNYDHDHEGHGGLHTDGMVNGSQIGLLGFAQPYNPDIVLIHLGTNDVADSIPPETSISNLQTLIQTYRQTNPRMMFLLAQIIPGNENAPPVGQYSIPPDYNIRAAQLNTQIAQLATQLNTPASPVIAVDQWTGIVPDQDLFDIYHPNDTGAQKMAQKWWDALHPVLQAAHVCQ